MFCTTNELYFKFIYIFLWIIQVHESGLALEVIGYVILKINPNPWLIHRGLFYLIYP